MTLWGSGSLCSVTEKKDSGMKVAFACSPYLFSPMQLSYLVLCHKTAHLS